MAIDQAHPNQRVSPQEVEATRRARRRQLRKDINDRIPPIAARTEPRTYEEDD